MSVDKGLTPIHAQAQEQRTKTFAGAGSVRDFRAGTTFTLTQHPVHDQDGPQSRAFVLTRVESAFRALKSELGHSARTTWHPSALHPQPAWRGQSPPPDPHLRQL